MAKRRGVKSDRKPKWKVQLLICLRCCKTFQPVNRKQELCENCGVLEMLHMANIGKNNVDRL